MQGQKGLALNCRWAGKEGRGWGLMCDWAGEVKSSIPSCIGNILVGTPVKFWPFFSLSVCIQFKYPSCLVFFFFFFCFYLFIYFFACELNYSFFFSSPLLPEAGR